MAEAVRRSARQKAAETQRVTFACRMAYMIPISWAVASSVDIEGKATERSEGGEETYGALTRYQPNWLPVMLACPRAARLQ